jgi:hypothetical protein
MTVSIAQLKDEMVDREAIRNCLYRYSRAIDRQDEDLLRTVYWPEATDVHLDFKGGVEAFIAWAMPQLRAMKQTMHMLGNILIELDGGRAKVESYLYSYHRLEMNGVMRDVVAGGRFLDKFERRGDEWRIAERFTLTDWFREYPDSADWALGPFGIGKTSQIAYGEPGPGDRSYTWLKFSR